MSLMENSRQEIYRLFAGKKRWDLFWKPFMFLDWASQGKSCHLWCPVCRDGLWLWSRASQISCTGWAQNSHSFRCWLGLLTSSFWVKEKYNKLFSGTRTFRLIVYCALGLWSSEKPFKGSPEFSPCMSDPQDKLLSSSLLFCFFLFMRFMKILN